MKIKATALSNSTPKEWVLTSNHSNHIPKPILHHHLLAEVVYRIRLLLNLQIQITYETKKIN